MSKNQEILNRIKDYLSSGGLFNPEMMEHDKARDLIMDCRYHIQNKESNTEINGCGGIATAFYSISE